MVAMVEQEQAVEGGCIVTITFQAADTGYSILKVERDDFSEFTAVGVMPDASKGLQVDLRGEWRVHPRYGKQFAFSGYSVPQPTTEDGSISFLSTLKGVGPSLAKTMWRTFGADVFRILDDDGNRLIEVKGIAEKKLPKILDSYQKSKGLRELISFLAEVGVSATYANRIYKVYGSNSITEIKRNPYILAEEVRGFGFTKADEVARALGIAPDSKHRTIAGLMHVLKLAASRQGHCFLPIDECCTKACEELVLPDYRPQMSDIEAVINDLQSSRTSRKQRLVVEGDRVFLESFHRAEEHYAIALRKLSGEFQSRLSLGLDIDSWINEYQQVEGIQLSKGQRDAVIAANRFGVVVVTGGPGVGKSSVSRAIVQSWHKQGKRIVGCTPTGKAGQRLKECTGLNKVSTIHRLLGWTGHGFEHGLENPIDADAFLIDEFSMVDIKLAAALFDAIPQHAVVVIVGDIDQLPSVGAGCVLSNVIESGQIPVVRLTEVFRQAATSKIIQASSAINKGEFPVLEQINRTTEKPYSDMLWLKCSKERIIEAIQWLIAERLPDWGWTQDDIQMLSPMHKGDYGNIAINRMAQDAWNPKARGKATVGDFRAGDRVIQTRNDYDKGVFNGDIGKILSIDATDKECKLWFPDINNTEGKIVSYDFSDMEDVMLSYSISIHRSQGSEFPVVIMPCTMSHYMMLQRNLYYTGITRGKKLVVLVGEERAIATAVKNYKVNQRNTALVERLIA